MKLAVVTSSAPFGAGESFVIAEAKALASAGVQIMMIPAILRSANPTYSLVSDNVTLMATGLFSRKVLLAFASVFVARPMTVLRLLRKVVACGPIAAVKNLMVFPKAVWLSEVLRRTGVTHVHAHWSSTPSTVAMVASQLAGLPWSCTAHRSDIVSNNLLDKKMLDAAFFRFISESGIALATRICGAVPPSVRLLHMGVNVPDSLVQDERTVRGKRIVLCPANLIKVKGHATLLSAWAYLENRENAELWLAGEGELRADLESLAKSLGLSASVNFTGHLAHDQLLSLYRRGEIDLVVLPSLDLGNGLHEGIPVSLMEAMAHGIPVISTRTGGIPELVSDSSGILVAPADVDGLSAAIRLLMNDAALACRLGSCGRERVAVAFNQKVVARTLIDWFRQANVSRCEE